MRRLPLRICAPHFLFETSKRKCAALGGKEKMFWQFAAKAVLFIFLERYSLHPATDGLTLHPRRAFRFATRLCLRMTEIERTPSTTQAAPAEIGVRAVGHAPKRMRCFPVHEGFDEHPKSGFSFDRERPFSFRQDEKKMGVQTFLPSWNGETPSTF